MKDVSPIFQWLEILVFSSRPKIKNKIEVPSHWTNYICLIWSIYLMVSYFDIMGGKRIWILQIRALYRHWSMQWWEAQGIWQWELWLLDRFLWPPCWVEWSISTRTQTFSSTWLSLLRSLLEFCRHHSVSSGDSLVYLPLFN